MRWNTASRILVAVSAFWLLLPGPGSAQTQAPAAQARPLSRRPARSPTSPPFSIRKSPIPPSARSAKPMPMRSRRPPRARRSENSISSAARPAPRSAAPRKRSPIAKRRCRSAAITSITSAACSKPGNPVPPDRRLQERRKSAAGDDRAISPTSRRAGCPDSSCAAPSDRCRSGDVPRAQNYVNRANAILDRKPELVESQCR